jgi:hypothetical protein
MVKIRKLPPGPEPKTRNAVRPKKGGWAYYSGRYVLPSAEGDGYLGHGRGVITEEEANRALAEDKRNQAEWTKYKKSKLDKVSAPS